MNTNIADCSGTPFTFHPEYSTAQDQNVVPWTALNAGVLMEQETGHFEPCDSVTNSFPVNDTFPGGQTFSDPQVAQTCVGGYEGAGKTGEGPCNPATGVCVGATTQGGVCPTDNFASGANCEFSDANCMPAGARAISVNGTAEMVSWPVAGCQAGIFQNGDLDFDGTPYVADWPDGSKNHPTSIFYTGPLTGGRPYPNIRFETDVAASEITCNTATGAGCTALPAGAAFYPFWTLGPLNGQSGNGCAWNFGNVIAGRTVQSFGGTAEYGSPEVTRFAGNIISQTLPNPQATC